MHALRIQRVIREQLTQHARQDAPIEACGYLAEKEGLVTAIFRMTNQDASPEHFSFDPAEQFAAVRQMRAAGLRMRAVYHSHPATPARPSAEDIRLANDPNLSYVIVSLAQDEPDVQSFIIRNAQVSVEPLEIEEH
jgi:[CysO sulfur-carrier protein]-S-L-cysteine hydrolase